MPTSQKTVLIIDDEMDLVLLLKHNLEQEGFSVLSSWDGETALEIVKDKNPDLIISDISLPGMDGFDFLRALRRERKTPMIFLTGVKNELCKKLSEKLGASDYITKPFSVESVLQRIRALLDAQDALSERNESVRAA